MDWSLRKRQGNIAGIFRVRATSSLPASYARRGLPRLTLLILSNLFLFAGFLALPAYASSPEGSRSLPWKEVLSFAPVNPGPVTWCGAQAVLAESREIVHIDIKTKKVTPITKDPLAKDPFCSHDGGKVFYYRIRIDPKIKEARLPDGIWAYDFKTGETRKVGTGTTDRMRNPASPKENIYALVAHEKKYLPDLEINLPGWRILRLPSDDRVVDGVSQWANDGSYLVLSERDKDKPVEKFTFSKVGIFVFLSPDGRLLGKVHSAPLRLGIVGAPPRALGNGLYIFGADGRLRRVNPGTIEGLLLKVTVSEKQLFTFDVSPAGEVVYSRLDGLKPGERPFLWLTNILGSPAGRSLRIRADHPRFSPTAEYLAVVEHTEQGNSVLTVLQRPTNRTDR